MRNSRKIETGRDRKALARDAGLGRFSLVSVVAGALGGLAALEILLILAGAVAVAIHGSTSFAGMSDGRFKATTAVVAAVALFVGFLFGGYVAGRLSRRSGALHGFLAGAAGLILSGLGAFAVIRTGTDNGLARVARHINVAATWHQWRFFGLAGIVVAAVAMVLGGLVGGIEGERWHGKLLARAVDPSFGPEADQRAEAHKRATEAEVARLAAANHVGRLTAAGKTAHPTPAATEPIASTEPTVPATSGRDTVRTSRPQVPGTDAGAYPGADRADRVAASDRAQAAASSDTAAADATVADGDTQSRRGRHHLLGRR